jgi:hypothetical protein
MSTAKGAIMAKARLQQTTRKASRPPRRANLERPDRDDVYELLLAELEARRVRLRELLQLVWTEAARQPARRSPARPHATCESGRLTRTA